jgi:hypothetical protein
LTIEFFCKDRTKRDDLHPHCKECRSKRWKKYKSENSELVNERGRLSYRKNVEKRKAHDRKRNQRPERKAYRLARNRSKLVKHHSLGKTYMNEVELIYKVTAFISKYEGTPYEVDHIIPIKGIGVSGLHVPWNLQILTQFENRSKGNSL